MGWAGRQSELVCCRPCFTVNAAAMDSLEQLGHIVGFPFLLSIHVNVTHDIDLCSRPQQHIAAAVHKSRQCSVGSIEPAVQCQRYRAGSTVPAATASAATACCSISLYRYSAQCPGQLKHLRRPWAVRSGPGCPGGGCLGPAGHLAAQMGAQHAERLQPGRQGRGRVEVHTGGPSRAAHGKVWHFPPVKKEINNELKGRPSASGPQHARTLLLHFPCIAYKNGVKGL